MPYIVQPTGEAVHGPCPDCGRQTRSVWGIISEGGRDRAAYFIRWTDGHVERGAQLMISVGRWGDGATPDDRRCVGLECRMGDDRPSFMVVDATALPWGREDFLGQKLTREVALNDVASREVFAMVDQLIEGDTRFRDFLLS
jgi:hypothetical protein